MFKEFVGQECVVTVAFSGPSVRGGVVPLEYTGKVLEEDEKFVKMNVYFAKSMGDLGTYKKNAGTTLINKNYIIAAELI